MLCVYSSAVTSFSVILVDTLLLIDTLNDTLSTMIDTLNTDKDLKLNKELCLYCNKEFTPQRKTAKYCSPECKRDYNRFKHKLEPSKKAERQPLKEECPSSNKIDMEYWNYRANKGLETTLDDNDHERKCMSCNKNFKTRLGLMRYCSLKCHPQFND